MGFNRASWVILVAAIACSSGGGDDEDGDGPGPTCRTAQDSTQYCNQAGLGTRGVRCNANGPDDGTWPTGCIQVNSAPTIELCCP